MGKKILFLGVLRIFDEYGLCPIKIFSIESRDFHTTIKISKLMKLPIPVLK
jgi:hypothetical protein